MTGMTKKGIMDLWNITDSGVDEPAALSKEIMQEHGRLQREYQTAVYRLSSSPKKSKASRDAEEVARANLFAFERRHGLTSSDPRIG